MVTARTTPSPDEYTADLVAYMDTTATGRSLLRASVTDNTPAETRTDQQQLRHRCGELKEAAASILIEFYCTLYILHVPYRDQRLIQRLFQARA